MKANCWPAEPSRLRNCKPLLFTLLLFGPSGVSAAESDTLALPLWPGGLFCVLAAFGLGMVTMFFLFRRRRICGTFGECARKNELQQVLARAESLNTKLQDVVAQHELLLNIMPIYVYAEDANDQYRHVFCNDICSELWGRPLNEVLGKNDAELFGDTEEIRRFQETDAAVVASGELHESLQPFTGKDGKRRMGRFFRKGIQLSGGRRWMFGLVIDVTEEYEQRAKVNELLSIFEYAFDLTQSAAFRFDPETREMTGALPLNGLWPIEDGKGLPPEKVVFAEDLERFSEAIGQLVAGKVESATVDYRSAYFGEMRYYRFKCGGNRNPYGKFTLAGVIQDVTEITRNLNKLQETLALQDIIVNSVPILFFAKDANRDFRYLLANRSLADFMGRTPEEVIGKTDAELLGENNNWHLADRDVMGKPGGVWTKEKSVDAAGASHFFQILKKPMIGLHGERLVLGVASDVTELSELNANQQTLNRCFSGLLAKDYEGDSMELVLKEIGQRLNASICYLLRYDREQALAWPEAEWRVDEEMPSALTLEPFPFTPDDSWFQVIDSEELIFAPDVNDPETIARFGLETEVNRRFGLQSVYAMRVLMGGKLWGSFGIGYRKPYTPNQYETEFIRSAGNLIGLMLVRKRNQEQLRSALEQAQNANRAKSFFLASMSHEIRTPLNAVIGLTELLVDDTLPPEEQREYLTGISNAGNTLLALINDVLDLSKLEAGQMQFSPTETDFTALMAEVGSIFRQKCTEKNLKFIADSGQLPLLWLDKLRIRQILFNLIGNAVKFTDAGEIRVTAAFVPENAEQGTLTFRVADTGIGIPEEDQPSLFQMFVQSHSQRGTAAAQSGTGLGLAIVHRMVGRMNGDIKLESALGKGSTFTVTIRGVKFKESATPDAEQMPGNKIPGSSSYRGSALLVDDVPINLKVMAAMLSKLGMTTMTAPNADEALKLLETHAFDFLLTDLWMPGMNGAELGSQVRRLPGLADMRMAVITADTESGDNFDLSVFDGVITKPVTLDKLRNFLQTTA